MGRGGDRPGQGGQGEPGLRRKADSGLGAAEDAARRISGARCPREWAADLAGGDHAGALARMNLFARLAKGRKAEARPKPPSQGRAGPDIVAWVGGAECRIAVCALENVPGLLEDDLHSTMPHGRGAHLEEAHGAVTRDILGAARERLGGQDGQGGQVVLAVADPDGAIVDHGGLDDALDAIGREMPWVSAVLVVRGGAHEVRGVPRSANPLRGEVRAALRGRGAVSGEGGARPSGAPPPAAGGARPEPPLCGRGGGEHGRV